MTITLDRSFATPLLLKTAFTPLLTLRCSS